MRLVIAEKPSVAQSIAAVLGAKSRHDGYLEGGGYIVSWCFGHLAELADAAVYNADDAKWTLAALPIIPTSFRFIVRSEKQKQFDILRELMRREDVTEVVNACDAGREGELIFRTVYCLAGCSKPILRLWISSMEDDAIRSGFQQHIIEVFHRKDLHGRAALHKVPEHHALHRNTLEDELIYHANINGGNDGALAGNDLHKAVLL